MEAIVWLDLESQPSIEGIISNSDFQFWSLRYSRFVGSHIFELRFWWVFPWISMTFYMCVSRVSRFFMDCQEFFKRSVVSCCVSMKFTKSSQNIIKLNFFGRKSISLILRRNWKYECLLYQRQIQVQHNLRNGASESKIVMKFN